MYYTIFIHNIKQVYEEYSYDETKLDILSHQVSNFGYLYSLYTTFMYTNIFILLNIYQAYMTIFHPPDIHSK